MALLELFSGLSRTALLSMTTAVLLILASLFQLFGVVSTRRVVRAPPESSADGTPQKRSRRSVFGWLFLALAMLNGLLAVMSAMERAD